MSARKQGSTAIPMPRMVALSTATMLLPRRTTFAPLRCSSIQVAPGIPAIASSKAMTSWPDRSVTGAGVPARPR